MELSYYLNEDIINKIYEGLYFVDTNRKIKFWNKGAERITGFKAEEVVGSYCHDNILNHVDQKNNQLCYSGCPLQKTLKDGQFREANVYLHHNDGHRVAVAVKIMPIFQDEKIIGAVEVFLDNINQAEFDNTIKELRKLALHDQLTELPNRRYINSFIDNRLKELNDLKIPFAVALVDIDYFKKVNDTYGHDIGDLTIKMVAKTLKNAFRKSDLVGRWGGEEFMAILTAVNKDELELISEKARKLIENSVLRTNDCTFNVTASFGATIAKENDTIESLTKRADEALYTSKNNGRNKITIS